ncbi:MAG: hypothetical protein ACRC9P_08450, partial [Bacteroides sp.]
MGRMVNKSTKLKWGLSLFLFLLLLGGMLSCSAEVEAPSSNQKGDVQMNFRLLTRSGNAEYSEQSLDDILVFVFTEGVLTDIYAHQVVDNSKLHFQLSSTNRHIKVHFLANTGLSLSGLKHVYGTHEKDFIHALPHLSAQLSYDLIPMWGSLDFPQGLEATDKDEAHKHSVQLLRAVAKIQIKLAKDISEEQFKLKSVRVYRAPKLVLVPDEEALHETEFRVTQATVPIQHTSEDESVQEAPLVLKNPSFPCTFYLGESEGLDEKEGSWAYVPTSIVVGG